MLPRPHCDSYSAPSNLQKWYKVQGASLLYLQLGETLSGSLDRSLMQMAYLSALDR